MELSEGKLFTIEALNRIDGFVWPETVEFAAMDASDDAVSLYRTEPCCEDDCFSIIGGYAGFQPVKKLHPDWSNSLITKAEFDSVDGWVRDMDEVVPECVKGKLIDVTDGKRTNNGIAADDVEWDASEYESGYFDKWRYHKPTKVNTMPAKSIDDIMRQYKAQKEISADAQKALDASKEAEDALLDQIKSWSLSHGFYIRLLDESEEKQGLVITDWRDLRIDDVVAWRVVGYRGEFTVHEVYRDNEGGNPCASIMEARGKKYNVYADELKFIRRPEKK